MKQILLILAAVVVGCGKKEDGNTGVVNPNKPSPKAAPEKLIIDPLVEKAIRRAAKKPTGELTKADLEKVTVLLLSDNQLTDVRGLESLTKLTALVLGYSKLTELPKGLENLTQLTELHLHDSKLTNVKGLEKLTQLEKLYLNGNQLTDVKGLEKLTQLTWLWLSYNRLTDVKGLEKLTKLEKLWLEDNPALTKAQIAELQKALPKCKISSNPTK